MDAEEILVQQKWGSMAVPINRHSCSSYLSTLPCKGLHGTYVGHGVDNSTDTLLSIHDACHNQQIWNAIIYYDARGGDIQFQRLY